MKFRITSIGIKGFSDCQRDILYGISTWILTGRILKFIEMLFLALLSIKCNGIFTINVVFKEINYLLFPALPLHNFVPM